MDNYSNLATVGDSLTNFLPILLGIMVIAVLGIIIAVILKNRNSKR